MEQYHTIPNHTKLTTDWYEPLFLILFIFGDSCFSQLKFVWKTPLKRMYKVIEGSEQCWYTRGILACSHTILLYEVRSTMYGNCAFDPFRSTGQSVGAVMSGTGFFGGKSRPPGKASSWPYWRTGQKKVCSHFLVFCESHEA